MFRWNLFSTKTPMSALDAVPSGVPGRTPRSTVSVAGQGKTRPSGSRRLFMSAHGDRGWRVTFLDV